MIPMKLQLVGLLCGAIACARGGASRDGDSSVPRACAGGGGILDGNHVGTLRIGMSIDSAKILCPTAVDTVEYMEGERVPVLIATLAGDSIRIYTQGSAIRTIWLGSPAFQTRDSLRVSIPLGRVLDLPSLAGGFGEGVFYVYDDRPTGPACGMSFQLDRATARKLVGVRRPLRETLRPYAESGRIIGVLVRGC